MISFDTLYTLDSKGKIRVFECEIKPVDDVSYNNFNYYVITRTGLLGGKLIEKKEIVKSGKQKRNIVEQAEFQAKSLWSEKLDEGYKSSEMIMVKDGYIFDARMSKEIHQKIVISLLNKYPEAAYTNSNWDELPMLAHKYKDIKNPVFPYYAQPKLDGVRCIVKKGNFGSVKLCSRGGQYYIVRHIEQQLSNLFDSLVESGIKHNNLMFDGEIYVHGVPLQDISGAARKEDDSVDMFRQASNSWLEYHIYDVINLDKPKETQKERYEHLLGLTLFLRNEPGFSHIKIVDTVVVNNKEDVNTLHDKYVSQGYEGLILRSLDGLYEFNNRSRNLLKVKQYQDEEFEIRGSAMQTDDPETFVFILKNNIDEQIFKARPTGTLAQKREWHSKIDSFIGKKATVRFFIRSKDGLPLQGAVHHKNSPILIHHIRPNGE